MKRNPLMTVVATGVLLGAATLTQAAGYASRPNDPATAQSDQQITDQVKGKLEADVPGVAPAITVMTHDGVVTLQGVALTSEYILKALNDARTVDGVVHVNNRLSIE